jgi:hypothetical protein
MRKGITFLLLTAVTSCASQNINKSELMIVLEKNINRIEFSKLSFFTKELIQLGADTSFQSKFRKKLGQHDSIKRKTEADQREYHVTLYLLYNKLAAENNYGKEYESGKDFLLGLLSGRSKIDFPVDENLVIQQIDAAKRSLVNGYDEGTVDESSFVFFCYNPLLYKKALLKNNLSDDWKRTGVFLCNYLRENENPMDLRNPIKKEILGMISRKEIQHEFKDIVKDIAECDVSSNLFD